MVSVLASSAVDCVLKPGRVKPKIIKFAFFGEHTSLRRKSIDLHTSICGPDIR